VLTLQHLLDVNTHMHMHRHLVISKVFLVSVQQEMEFYTT